MVAPAIIAALAALDEDAMLAAMIGEGIGYIDADTDPLTFDPRSQTGVGGVTFQVVAWQEKFWWRDTSDVSAADEITVITLADGVNYLTNDVRMPCAVISRTVTAPPLEASRTLGDAHLVPAAATGEWATHDDDVALWTARGYYYVPPAVGALLYIRDELGYIHYSEGNTWEDGIGTYAFEDNSIAPRHLLIRAWDAENQSTTAPPATGPAGETYIIGAGATGAWLGHDKKIAYRPSTDATFVILTPFTQERVADKALGHSVEWNGTAWISAAGSIIGFKSTAIETATLSGFGSSTYSWSATTAPTTSHYRGQEEITFTAKKAGNLIFFDYRGVINNVSASTYVPAVWIDGASNAADWTKVLIAADLDPVNFTLMVTAPDNAEHTYKIGLVVQGAALTPNQARRRLLRISEAPES